MSNEMKKVSAKDIKIVAENATNDKSVEVINYELVPYSAERLGYAANHLQLNISYKRKDMSIENLSAFVKTTPFDSDTQMKTSDYEDVYSKEAYIFENVFPKLLENYKGDMWTPTCFLARKDTLILEDLRTKHYKLVSQFLNDLKFLKPGLAAVARFHSCSILAEARLSKEANTPKTLIDCYPDACVEAIFTRAKRMAQFISSSVKVVLAVGERLNYNVHKLRRAFDLIYEKVKPSKEHQNVLCHADLWANNMMFNDNHSPPKCVLVDFQVVRYGPLVLDLLHFLHLNTSSDFREKHEKDLVKFYHHILEETVVKNDVTREAKIPTVDETFIAMEDLRLYGVGITAIYAPLGLLDAKTKEEKMSNPETFFNFLAEDRVEITMKCMENDPVCKNAIEQLVTEVARISEKLF